MAAQAGLGATEELASGIESLPDDLLSSILGRVSEMSRGYSHALVCRRWAALAPSAQLSCAVPFRVKDAGGSEDAGGSQVEGESEDVREVHGEDVSQVSQELSLFPSFTSLDITATKLPGSFLSFAPSSLKHLWVHGPDTPLWVPWDEEFTWGSPAVCGEDTALQGLARFQGLYTLHVLNYKIPEDDWPLTASLRHLDVGGLGEMVPLEYPEWGMSPCASGARRCRCSANLLTDVVLQGISQLRELRVFRATLADSVVTLPESMSRLTDLEELNLSGPGLRSFFSGIGGCRKLKRLLFDTWASFDLPPSITKLRRLSFMYANAETVRAPPGMDALTSLRIIEKSARRDTPVSEADALFRVLSLQQLNTTGLPTDMTMLTSLQELILSSSEFMHTTENYPESMWALGNLRVLKLEGRTLRALPESISGLSRLEELKIAGCPNIEDLPDSLAVLPHLKKLTLEHNGKLRSLPSFIDGAWPSLQFLQLRFLRRLEMSEVEHGLLLAKVKDVQSDYCPGTFKSVSEGGSRPEPWRPPGIDLADL